MSGLDTGLFSTPHLRWVQVYTRKFRSLLNHQPYPTNEI